MSAHVFLNLLTSWGKEIKWETPSDNPLIMNDIKSCLINDIKNLSDNLLIMSDIKSSSDNPLIISDIKTHLIIYSL